MNMFTRKIWALIGAVGIIIAGVGAGICFVEFSGFSYGGKILMGTEEKTTTEKTVEVEDNGEIYIRNYNVTENVTIESSQEVAENQLKVNAVYNKNTVRDINVERINVEEEASTDIELYAYYGGSEVGDGFEEFMSYKDQFLSDLKEKKISSYVENDVESVVIYVNPKNLERIHII